MRADRLLSILMLLQVRGRMTAQDLANELEVSVRTIYRDIDALSITGVPIFCERGPGGGCELLESYRTNLTGLTENEVRALFMLSIPAPLGDLGVVNELKSALLKLSAALPEFQRGDEALMRKRIHLDSMSWEQTNESIPCLGAIQSALWQNRRLKLIFHSSFDTHLEMIVDPFGLVAKTNIWYLVCKRRDHMRVLRVARIVEAYALNETFPQPKHFDLTVFWDNWCADVENNRPHFEVTLRVSPELIPHLPHQFGDDIQDVITQSETDEDSGWKTITLTFKNLTSAREQILNYGCAMEVLAPIALRRSIIDYAEQIRQIYKL